MSELLYTVLSRRYGAPQELQKEGFFADCWNVAHEDIACILYKGMDWNLHDEEFIHSYKPIYGNYFAGFILGDALRLTNLLSVPVYGLWQAEEFQKQPEVQRAKELDPETKYFLDAANVWFYGHKNGHLFVFDSETDELDDLGALERAMDTLISEWEKAKER